MSKSNAFNALPMIKHDRLFGPTWLDVGPSWSSYWAELVGPSWLGRVGQWAELTRSHIKHALGLTSFCFEAKF